MIARSPGFSREFFLEAIFLCDFAYSSTNSDSNRNSISSNTNRNSNSTCDSFSS